MAAPTEPDSGLSIPPHPDGWTVDEVLALPEDQTSLQRIELVDGALLVSPWLCGLGGEDYEPVAKSEAGKLTFTRPFEAEITLA